MLDYLIQNVRIIDGTGKPSHIADLGILNGKLVTAPEGMCARQRIDGKGLCAAPGFIDAHSHGDLLMGSVDARLFKTTQGVTTEITGQCGLSMAPVARENLKAIQNMLYMGTTWFPEEMGNWNSFQKYLEYADELEKTTHAKFYIGHSTLRIAVMGMENRPATAAELDTMQGLLREAMQAGASGFSTGLIYTPSCYAAEEEIISLAKVIAPYNGVYASHMRNEAERVEESLAETIRVGQKSGVMVDVSHHKIMGRPNWGKQKRTLEMIHKANEQGTAVICDQYPYTRCMTTLNACMPPWHFHKGFDSMTDQLRSAAFRTQLRREMEDPETPYDNFYLNAGGWQGVSVYSAAKTPEAEGLSIAEYAQKIGKDPWTAFFDLCQENNCSTGGVYDSMCEEDICEIFLDPYCIVGSDGLTRSWAEKGHPRGSATFPYVIRHFVKEKGLLSLEQAVAKMTGMTADYLRVKNKGFIREGYDADILLFDYDRLADTATYIHSNSITEGIHSVFVDGQMVYRDKQFTGAMPGRILRHNA